jgi:hypothetical protein
MHTPTSTPAVSQAPALSWRALILWLAFAATLGTGLVLAVRLGATVPAFVDGAMR